MANAATKTAPAKASKATQATDTSSQVSLEEQIVELQKQNAELNSQLAEAHGTIKELLEIIEKLEIKQRLWVNAPSKDAPLYTVGTTKAGAKKVTIHAQKSCKDSNGKYVAGAMKTLVLTDNGYGDLATQFLLEIEKSDNRLFDFEMFEKTFVGRDGKHNSFYMVTSFGGRDLQAPAPTADAPTADELDSLV